MSKTNPETNSGKSFWQQINWTYIVALSLFGAGMIAGVLLDKKINSAAISCGFKEVRQGGYRYINPLLECDVPGVSISKGATPFRSLLEDYINKRIASGKINVAAAYYRELDNGPWFGINIEDKFIPASLLKVPLAMAYFKMAETDPGILKKELQLDKPDEYLKVVQQTIPPLKKIELGKKYTVEDLIERALIYSDNAAAFLLNKNVNVSILLNVYKDVGANFYVLQSPENALSVISYASFFRILYNSSYLSRDSSEKILGILANSQFRNGLEAGVPPSIYIAHKFGEVGVPGGLIQFHDCGIVYYPNQPYLLCVMTRGRDENELIKSIQDISHIAYTEVDRQFGSPNR